MPEEKKTKRINSYNIALRDWNAERKKQGHKWSSPKKGTPEYDEIQNLKKQIEENKNKPIKKIVSFNDESVKTEASNVRKRDSYDATIKKLMKSNNLLTERIVKETDPKQVFKLVEKLNENTQMLTKARQLKDGQQ